MLSILKAEPEYLIELKGELTIFQAELLFSEFKALPLETVSLIIDMRQVSELDSSAIQILLALKKYLKQYEQKLTLVNHSDQVLKALSMLGLSGYFNDLIVEV